MRKAVLVFISLSLLALFILCSKEPDNIDYIDITDFYISTDSTTYIEYINTNQWETRVQLSVLLKKYLLLKSKGDSVSIQEFQKQMAWLIPSYKQQTGVGDLGVIFNLFRNWNISEIETKIRLDSELGLMVNSRDSIPADKYIERLHDFRSQYISLGDDVGAAGAYYQLAKEYYNRQEIDSSLVYLSKTKTQYRELDDYYSMAKCEMLTAQIHNIFLGDYFKSEQAYLNALKYYHKTGNENECHIANFGLGYDYFQLGQIEKAASRIRSALAGFTAVNQTDLVAYCLNYLAEIYYNQGKLDSAFYYVEKSLNIRKKIANKKNDRQSFKDVAHSQSTSGLIYQAQKKAKKSIQNYLRADSLFRSVGDSSGFCLNLIRMASFYFEKNRYDTAEVMYRTALSMTEKYEKTIFASYGLALCRYYLGDFNTAKKSLNACIQFCESSRKKLPVPELKTGMLADKIGFYHLLANIYLKEFGNSKDVYSFDSAFAVIERSKAAALIDMLSENRTAGKTEDEENLLTAISRKYRAMILNEEEPDSVLQDIEQLEESLDRLRITTANRKNDFLDSHIDSRINIETAQQSLLHEHDVLMEYVTSEFGSYVMLIDKNSCDVIPINLKYENLTDIIEKYIAAISTYPENITDIYSTNRLGKQLYTHLIPDNLQEQSDVENIIIVPSGLLNYLPFETLIDKNDNYLIEHYNLSYAPSATTIRLINGRKKPVSTAENILAIGNPTFNIDNKKILDENNSKSDFRIYEKWKAIPLTSVHEEMESIKNLFGKDKATVYLSENATEENFKSADFSKIKYIHMASHGICNDRHPNRSAILLSSGADTTDDGLLHPDEIIRLNLSAELVFLSACQTGSGKLYPGEGNINLARPFLAAGCKSAIVSLWNINDKSTAIFAKDFYKNIITGYSISQSLALSKREFIHSPREAYRHPYFWAPFILFGGYTGNETDK